jgi:hypothetical protein
MIASQSPLWSKALGIMLLVFVVPVAIVVKLVTMPFERATEMSAPEVVKYLRDFMDGTGGDWDWDDFISIQIADPRLEAIREVAAALDLPMSDDETGPLEALIAEAEAIADA